MIIFSRIVGWLSLVAIAISSVYLIVLCALGLQAITEGHRKQMQHRARMAG